MNKEKEYVKEEIRKEFQLERMVLFSDAVFAIAITLMAIEIHIPETGRMISSDQLAGEIIKLIPTMIAYAASFTFIGFTWYQHLQVFSLLKDYDKGLVWRNLLMLFFIGFFPFGASLISRPSNGFYLVVVIYFMVIILCKGAQLMLHHYILFKRPNLRINAAVHEEILSFKRSRVATTSLVVMFLLVSATSFFIKDPNLKPVAWWWFFPFPLVLKYFQRKFK